MNTRQYEDLVSGGKGVIAEPLSPEQTAGPGFHVCAGAIFYKLLDGSSVRCNCIGGPYVSEIQEAVNKQISK